MDHNQVSEMVDLLQKAEREGDTTEAARLYDQVLSILVRAKRSGAANVDPTLRSLAFSYAHFLNKHERNRDYGAKLNENPEWVMQINTVRQVTARPAAAAKFAPAAQEKSSFLGKLFGKK